VLIDIRLLDWSDPFDVVQQLIQVERLGQASPSAHATARFSVVTAGHHHQRHPPPLGPLSQYAHQSSAIHNRHVQIEDQRVWTVLAESRERLLTVACRVHLIAVRAEGVGDHASDGSIVVHD
jgi:hypothetical protein